MSVRASRRTVVQRLAALGATSLLPTRPANAAVGFGYTALSGTAFDLRIGAATVDVTGNRTTATLVDQLLPGPVLHWREGDTVTLRVRNTLDAPTSIHWHGIRSPSAMDGVPGLSFAGIAPGETFTYRIPLPIVSVATAAHRL